MEVLKELIYIIEELFKVPTDVSEKNISTPLLNEPFSLTPEELLYLFFYLEKDFNISFSKKDVINYSFLTIEKISNIIIHQLKVS